MGGIRDARSGEARCNPPIIWQYASKKKVTFEKGPPPPYHVYWSRKLGNGVSDDIDDSGVRARAKNHQSFSQHVDSNIPLVHDILKTL